jgi:hypothetical protein
VTVDAGQNVGVSYCTFFDQVHAAAQQSFEIGFGAEEAVQAWLDIRFILHQKIGVTMFLVKIICSSGRAKNLQATNPVTLAYSRDIGAVLGDGGMHVR